MPFELPGFVPTIQFSWTTTAVFVTAVLVVVAIIGNSGLRPGVKRRVTFVSLVGSLAIVWAVLYDLGEIPAGGYVPELGPAFFSLWALAMLGLLPVLFALLGGVRDADYHPRWAPWAYLTKTVSFVGSVLSIFGFYLQHLA